jgi:hypothetical protein
VAPAELPMARIVVFLVIDSSKSYNTRSYEERIRQDPSRVRIPLWHNGLVQQTGGQSRGEAAA